MQVTMYVPALCMIGMINNCVAYKLDVCKRHNVRSAYLLPIRVIDS